MERVKTTQLPVVVGANTKKEIESLADAIVSDLMDKGNPLEIAEMLSSTEHLVKTIKADKRYSEYVQQTLSLSSGKFQTGSGTKIEACETGVEYHFENCNDTELGMYEAELTAAKNKVKAREEFLKTVPKEGLTVVEPFSGEVITIYPPYKTSKTSYKCTLAK